jgi:hypothetical protein
MVDETRTDGKRMAGVRSLPYLKIETWATQRDYSLFVEESAEIYSHE